MSVITVLNHIILSPAESHMVNRSWEIFSSFSQKHKAIQLCLYFVWVIPNSLSKETLLGYPFSFKTKLCSVFTGVQFLYCSLGITNYHMTTIYCHINQSDASVQYFAILHAVGKTNRTDIAFTVTFIHENEFGT